MALSISLNFAINNGCTGCTLKTAVKKLKSKLLSQNHNIKPKF
jgi:G3E family GTPase